ncbi:MAG: hypothetical protein AB7T48_14180 [Solirubrobacterales bacterium]
MSKSPDLTTLAEMRGRLDAWKRETEDPLLDGPVLPPPGAAVNEQWQVSADDPVRIAAPVEGSGSGGAGGGTETAGGRR